MLAVRSTHPNQPWAYDQGAQSDSRAAQRKYGAAFSLYPISLKLTIEPLSGDADEIIQVRIIDVEKRPLTSGSTHVFHHVSSGPDLH